MDASDIVQEVLVEANRRLRAYLDNPNMPFHLWLRQMARDRLIDAHRRHRCSSKRSVDRECARVVPSWDDDPTMELVAQLSDHQLTPGAAATMQELRRRFEGALCHLDELDREVIIMRHVEQLTNREVAISLKLSEPAASMRHLRAMRRLRKLLSEPASED
jgi:RNA polymerase sigma-70 factor (ECF subfamily)